MNKLFHTFMFIALAFIAGTSTALADPPADFMNAPVLIQSPVTGKTGTLGISVGQLSNKLTDGTQYSWKKINANEWRLKSEEVDKMTDSKHTGLWLFAGDNHGVKLARMVVDGEEMGRIEMYKFLTHHSREITKGSRLARGGQRPL